jgi:hypothetical protein
MEDVKTEAEAEAEYLGDFRLKVLFAVFNKLNELQINWHLPSTPWSEHEKHWRNIYPELFIEAEIEVTILEAKHRMNLIGDTE